MIEWWGHSSEGGKVTLFLEEGEIYVWPVKQYPFTTRLLLPACGQLVNNSEVTFMVSQT